MSWYLPQAAATDLADVLVCGWTARAEGEHLLVPDACMDILWIRGVGIRVCGPETSAWSFTLPPGTESVGVRFRPGSAAPLLRIPASDLRNARAELSDLTGSRTSRILLDRLENTPATQRVIVLEDMVRSWNRSTRSPDPVASAVGAALAHHSWSVDALADHAALTSRQLQRRCNDAFGYGPATLRAILRLQRFMTLARRRSSIPLAGLAALAGYSDQAHLSRDCRRISSMTPAELLRSEAPDWHGPGSVVTFSENVRNNQSRSRRHPEESVA